jgi:lysophospholipase L1-like esterase
MADSSPLPINIRLLIIGDSHCREMGGYIANINNGIKMLTVCKGRQSDEIRELYRARIPNIISFDPQVIILHYGHNDLSYHVRHNQQPSLSRDLASETATFAGVVQRLCPKATIHLSAVFPRTFKRKSSLSQSQVVSYNRTAKRHGHRIREVAERDGFQHIYNIPLWSKISKYEEKPNLYLIDGLHLNVAGSEAIANCWVEHIVPTKKSHASKVGVGDRETEALGREPRGAEKQ